MNTNKYAVFLTTTEIHHGIIYDKIVGIYNKNTDSFIMNGEPDNIDVIIRNENLLSLAVFQFLKNNENNMIVCFDRYNRVTNIINKSNYDYNFILETDNSFDLETLIFDYLDDLKHIDDLETRYQKFNLVKHDFKSHELKEKTYNFVAKKLEDLIGYEYSLSDVGINLRVDSLFYDAYLPTSNDIIKIYGLLLDNKYKFNEIRNLKKCVQRGIIVYKKDLIDGAYETTVSKTVDVKITDLDYILNLIKELNSFMPSGADITYRVYQKHVKVKFNDIAYNYLLGIKDKASFITDINNILVGKDC
jgi:hypothetical protein